MVYELEFIGNSDLCYILAGELSVASVAIGEMHPDYSVYVPGAVAALVLELKRKLGVSMALIIAVGRNEIATDVGVMIQPVILKNRPVEPG